MSDQGIKSRPKYAPLELDPAGRHHLLLVEGPALPAEALAEGFEPTAFETWTVVNRSALLPVSVVDTQGESVRPFRANGHLFSALEERLARETMGLRLYAIGSEPFLWDVFRIADKAGMSRQEIRLAHAGSKARRVFCVHCRTYGEGVTTSIFTCGGCGANLFVRDHFSRRHAAFMGVQVDAEVPGAVPDAEELYA